MSVSAISNETVSSQSSWRSKIHQAKMDFKDLFQAMASNDITGAQQAYAAIQQLQSSLSTNQAAPSTSAAQSTSAASSTSDPLATVNTDWTSLGQALQSGNLSSAQQALSQLGQDALAAQQARMQQVASATSTLKSDLQSLNQAIKSGDTSSAQSLLAQLEQDLRSSRMAFGSAQPAASTSSTSSNNTTTATS